MRLLVDALHQRSGGGLQVALATVDALPDVPGLTDFELLCVRGSPLAEQARARRIPLRQVPDSELARFSDFARGRPPIDMSRYDCVYTIYGPPIRRRGHAVNVSGVAYSYLFYPDVDYWAGTPAHRRPARWLRDRLRLSSIQRADGWVFETETLRGRAIAQLGLDPARTTVITPGPSPFVTNPRPCARLAQRLRMLPDRPRVLLAADFYPNKNLTAVPRVARACRRLFGESPLFVFTLDPAGPGATVIRGLADQLGVRDDVFFLGRVSQQSIGQALAEAHCVLLLSEVESFSSNIIEAFVSGLPLVISDRDWARASCADAAVYVEPREPGSVARGLAEAMGAARDRLVARGAELARTRYLTQSERAAAAVRFLTHVHQLGRIESRKK